MTQTLSKVILRLSRLKVRCELFIKKIIPFHYHYYFEKKRRAAFIHNIRQNGVRQDVVHFAIADNAYFEVYWKIYGIGRGPALVLFIDNEEIIKFDFFGITGHFHIQTMLPEPPKQTKQNRLFMPEKTVEAQINRAFFELENNLYWYLERHPLAVVRRFHIEKAHLRQLLREIRPLLMAYQTRVPLETSPKAVTKA